MEIALLKIFSVFIIQVDLIERSALRQLKQNVDMLGASKVLFTDLKHKSNSTAYNVSLL